ncbi:MAG: type III pantothenate kinase [Pseudobutyrivibrio sp.]|nr:type III pantothenate kinase [Pseudobutyrivibrio sp.]
MLLAIDVGNTNITLGVFDGEELLGNFRVTTKINRTSDEFGVVFKDILRANDLDFAKVEDVIIASVVPAVMHSLTSSIIKYFNITPVIVEAGIKTGIRIATENPKQIGADRIVDAAGAFELYGGPVIVIDYGTATTYDLVDGTGAFMAGVTAPGIRISAKALWQDAAKLPEIEIKKPEKILAKETISSMQAGLVYGQIGQTEYIVKHMIEESGFENVKVVATGGLGNLISSETACIDIYNPNLTLYGMKFIYDKQKK